MDIALTTVTTGGQAAGPPLIDGAIDLHCHFGPEPLIAKVTGTEHSVDPFQAAADAARLGMRGFVLKGHEFPTTVAAHMLRSQFPGLAVFGGICCDFPVGGVNPGAVEVALDAGAAIVWLPTISAAHNNPFLAASGRKGLRVADEDGKLLNEVHEVLRLVRAHGAVLATGHVSAAEHMALAREFGGTGRLLVTHAMQRGVGPELTVQDCRELAGLGAVIEFSAHSCMGRPALFASVLTALRALDTSSVIVSTDYGWTTAAPRPAGGFASYLRALRDAGVPERTLRELAAGNPSRLLGLDINS